MTPCYESGATFVLTAVVRQISMLPDSRAFGRSRQLRYCFALCDAMIAARAFIAPYS